MLHLSCLLFIIFLSRIFNIIFYFMIIWETIWLKISFIFFFISRIIEQFIESNYIKNYMYEIIIFWILFYFFFGLYLKNYSLHVIILNYCICIYGLNNLWRYSIYYFLIFVIIWIRWTGSVLIFWIVIKKFKVYWVFTFLDIFLLFDMK